MNENKNCSNCKFGATMTDQLPCKECLQCNESFSLKWEPEEMDKKSCNNCRFKYLDLSQEPCERCAEENPECKYWEPKEMDKEEKEEKKYAFTQEIMDALEVGKEVWMHKKGDKTNFWQVINKLDNWSIRATYMSEWSLTKPNTTVTKTCERWVTNEVIRCLNNNQTVEDLLLINKTSIRSNKITITYETEE